MSSALQIKSVPIPRLCLFALVADGQKTTNMFFVNSNPLKYTKIVMKPTDITEVVGELQLSCIAIFLGPGVEI